jgi:uncharacterized membrane protein YfcA
VTVALLVLLVVTGCVAQAVSGIGFGLITGPVLVGAYGHGEGVRIAVLLSAVVNVVVLAREHRHVQWHSVGLLLVPAAVATPLVALALRDSPERLDEALAGLVAVVGAAVIASGIRWPAARGRRGAVGAALVSAASNTVAGIGGPPVALWADNAGWSQATVRATLQVYFLGLNLVALLSLGLPEHAERLGVALAAMVVGLALGHLVAGHVTADEARRTTLALAFAGGAFVLVRAASG